MPRPVRKYHKRYEPVNEGPERKHPLYSIWANMLERCYFEKSKAFFNYGGRGITVCDEWLHFKNFAYDMGAKPFKNATIERKNNNLGYSKENCIWADRTQQNFNRRKFKSNTTGSTGVVPVGNTYEARLDYKGVRYRLGRFSSIELAKIARLTAENQIKRGLIPIIPNETLWSTSSTKHRGITSHKDGGYVVRVTENSIRVYVGYYKTLEEAINAKLARNTR